MTTEGEPMSSNEPGGEQPWHPRDDGCDVVLRARCKNCDSPIGYIVEFEPRNVVWCMCGEFQYECHEGPPP